MVSRAILNGWPLIAGQKTGAAAPVSLGALSLSIATGTVGSPLFAAILGQTTGSLVTLSGAGAAGLTVSGSSVTGTPTTAGAVNLVETFGAAINSPRTSSGVLTVSAAAVTLGPLSLSVTTATAGTAYTATISGKTSGSTITVSGTGSSGLSVSGTTLSGTPSTAGSVDLVETLTGATNTPRTSSGILTVASAGTAPTLNALTVTDMSMVPATGRPYAGQVNGLTNGSTPSLTGAGAAGLVVSSTGAISGTPAATGVINVVETLAGATNTPRTSSAVKTVFDGIPDAFTFATPINNAPAFSFVTFKPTAPLSGYDTPLLFSLSGGIQYSIDDGATFASSGTLPIPSTLQNKWVIQIPTGAGGSTATPTITAGGTSATLTINVSASSSASPLTAMGAGAYGWLDATDPATMFQDTAGTVPIVVGGTDAQRTVLAMRMKTVANPAGDPGFLWKPSAAYTDAFNDNSPARSGPIWKPDLMNSGQSAGLYFDAKETASNGRDLQIDLSAMGGRTTFSVGICWTSFPMNSGSNGGSAVSFNQTNARHRSFDAGTGAFKSGDNYGATGPSFDYGEAVWDGAVVPNGSPGGLSNGQPVRTYFTTNGTARSSQAVALNNPVVATGVSAASTSATLPNFIIGGSRSGGGGFVASKIGIQSVIIATTDLVAAGVLNAVDAEHRARMGSSVYTVPMDATAPTTTTSAVAAGASSIPVASTTGFGGNYTTMTSAQRKVIFPVTQGYGQKGPGGIWPSQSMTNETTILAVTYSNPDRYVYALDTGKVYGSKIDQYTIQGSRSGTTLTVTSGAPRLGALVTGGTSGDFVEEQLSGTTGGAGTYRTTLSATMAAGTLTLRGGGGYYGWESNRYYYTKRFAVPLPLVTTVTVSGGNLVLPAGVTLQADIPSGSSIVVDQGPILRALSGPDGARFNITGSGTLFYTGVIPIIGKKDWIINGPGHNNMTLKQARGADTRGFYFFQCVSPSIMNLDLEGNFAWASTGSDPTTQPGTYATGIFSNFGYDYNGPGALVKFELCSDAYSKNIYCSKFMWAVKGSYLSRGSRTTCPDGTPFTLEDGVTPIAYLLHNTTLRMTQPHQNYEDWPFGVADSGSIESPVKGDHRDTVIDYDYMSWAFESFRSNGGYWTRITNKNGLGAMNSSARITITGLDMLFTALCRDRTTIDPMANQALLNLNNNVGNVSGFGAGSGGTCAVKRIRVEGWHDSLGSVMAAIAVSAQPGWTITGTYNPTVKDDGLRQGLIEVAVPKAGVFGSPSVPGDPTYACAAGPNVKGDSNTFNVSGLRLKPIFVAGSDTYPQSYPTSIVASVGDGSSITNTITGAASPDVGMGSGGTLAGNVSNAAYAALP